jgi:hypothetical protein
VNFGGYLYDWVTVANAARVGAQYAAMGAAYASYPTVPTLANIKTVILNETAALRGASTTNPTVTVCENQNGTAVAFPPTGIPPAACPAGVPAPPPDPETITGGAGASLYTSVSINVAYTYTPFIPGGYVFLGLGIIPPPSTTINKRIVMRVLN